MSTPSLAMPKTSYRFAKFELCSGELRAEGVRVRLQEKPLLLLTALLERPRQVVTRDELRHRMWPSETFVDYEHGINVAIKKVRDALGDSADRPQYIETLAKKGYRFLQEVEVLGSSVGQSAAATTVTPARHSSSASATWPVVSKWLISMGIAGVLVVSFVAVTLLQQRRNLATQIKSIAVLPLQNLSGDPEQEYFADGITDDLITNLAQLRNLRVISRTSAMRYKQTREPLSQVARELGVDGIVEGSVSRSGNRVHITAQLIDGATDRHLWASSYERDLGDALMIQTEIAQEISNQVGATLTSQETSAKARAVNPEVYDLCLLGRYHWNKRTEADLRKAIDYFQTATVRDPSYAAAFAGLATAYAILPYYSQAPVEEMRAKAKAAAERALQIDETVAEAHATLAFLSVSTPNVDWTTADREFRRALELNPSYATAHHWYAFYLLFADRQQEALAQAELARQLDPLSQIINADEGAFLYAAHRPEEAIALLRRAIELAPDFGQPHQTLALIDAQNGKMSEALVETRIALSLDPNNPRTMAEAGYVLAATNKRVEAENILAKLKKAIQDDSHHPLFLYPTFIYIGLGERDRAIDFLEKSCDPQTGAAPYGLVQWTFFETLASDVRYQQLLLRMREMRANKISSTASGRRIARDFASRSSELY